MTYRYYSLPPLRYCSTYVVGVNTDTAVRKQNSYLNFTAKNLFVYKIRTVRMMNNSQFRLSTRPPTEKGRKK